MHSKKRTVGVEEELLLVDPSTYDPVAVIEPLMLSHEKLTAKETDPLTDIHLEREVKQEQIEVVSPPLDSLAEIFENIIAGRALANNAAKKFDARAVALGTSPISVNSNLVANSRFEEMKKHFGLTLREQLTCGFHIHVSITSEEEGVAVLNRIRPWLSLLLALSTNSPMWNGKDTNFASYRYQAWLRWPSAGAYGVFDSVTDYKETINSLVSTGVLLDKGMIYFDARLCDRYPTVEIRISDVCLDPEHAAALAAITRALVEVSATEWKAGIPARNVSTSILKMAAWSASRYGVAKNLVCPLTDEKIDAAQAVQLLLTYINEPLENYDEKDQVLKAITNIFESGSGAVIQRNILHETKNPKEIVKKAIALSTQEEKEKV